MINGSVDSNKWINQEHGIRANHSFTSDKDVSLLKRIKYLAKALILELAYIIKMLFCKASKDSFSVSKKYSNLTHISDKKALVVFVPGLNDTPGAWNRRIQEFEKVGNADIFAPSVEKSGHCALDDKGLNSAIYQPVIQWAKSHENCPIIIYGHSNGVRISLELETLLREAAPKNPLALFLIAGASFGTSLIQAFSKKMKPSNLEKVSAKFVTKIVFEQLALGSDACQNLLKNVREPLKEGVAPRQYFKYAAMQDVIIPEYGSSLPILSPNKQKGKVEKDYLLQGYGHGSILFAKVNEQVELTQKFIDEQL